MIIINNYIFGLFNDDTTIEEVQTYFTCQENAREFAKRRKKRLGLYSYIDFLMYLILGVPNYEQSYKANYISTNWERNTVNQWRKNVKVFLGKDENSVHVSEQQTLQELYELISNLDFLGAKDILCLLDLLNSGELDMIGSYSIRYRYTKDSIIKEVAEALLDEKKETREYRLYIETEPEQMMQYVSMQLNEINLTKEVGAYTACYMLASTLIQKLVSSRLALIADYIVHTKKNNTSKGDADKKLAISNSIEDKLHIFDGSMRFMMMDMSNPQVANAVNSYRLQLAETYAINAIRNLCIHSYYVISIEELDCCLELLNKSIENYRRDWCGLKTGTNLGS